MFTASEWLFQNVNVRKMHVRVRVCKSVVSHTQKAINNHSIDYW